MHLQPKRALIRVTVAFLLASTLSCPRDGAAEEGADWEQAGELAAPEAIQAAAVQGPIVYAIASRQVAKYERATGRRIALSTGDATHLNSGFLWKGNLLCAHSNYPKTPEKSEIKMLDPASMRLSTWRDFGDFGGSLTWLVHHDGSWWCNFARYGDDNAKTFFVRFNDDWVEQQRWTYPDAVIKQLGRYSLSGGLWYGDELLVTGHDNQEFYRLRLPKSGGVLEYLGRTPVPFTGQGFAVDGVTGGLVGINRAKRKVVFVERGDAVLTADVEMPARGICAHRGASETHPENTLAAFREAIRLGAHMIEFDVALTKDGKLVLMHDATVDRTTDGTGPVSGLTLSELKGFDAGAWKHARFKGERIPTLDEALAIMPDNIWLNVHLKGGVELAEKTAKSIIRHQRRHQAFLACGAAAAQAARRIDDRILICNMERQGNSLKYVNETIAMQAGFIQLYGGRSVDPAHTRRLRNHSVRINFCCANDAEVVDALFKAGVEFPLVDRLEPMLKVADRHGVKRLRPVYRPRITHGPAVGHVTTDSALVWARLSTPGEYQLTLLNERGETVNTIASKAVPENDNCVRWHVNDLAPGSRYRYSVESDRNRLVNSSDCFLATADSDSSATVRLAFGSCAREDEGSAAVWRRMRSFDPHAVILLGDTPYIDSTSLEFQRRRYQEFAAVPEFQALVRNRSLYATWDDHDFGRNDTNGKLPGKEKSRQAFNEYRPNPTCGENGKGIYTKFRRGAVEVFLLDTRFFAATEPSPFDATKPSLLGASQWRWLQRGLKESTAAFKVLACGMIWNKAVRPGKQDHWGTYPHERDALFEFIGLEGIGGVVLIGGDIHRSRALRHQSTELAGYRIPELITSPVHDGVIANANAPHPALVHDSGKPNSFLLITVQGRAGREALTARMLDRLGNVFFQMPLMASELKK